ncbi:MAG: hypothetical protein ACE5K0_09355 [Candidatus Methanofastidiosia archaeon]
MLEKIKDHSLLEKPMRVSRYTFDVKGLSFWGVLLKERYCKGKIFLSLGGGIEVKCLR